MTKKKEVIKGISQFEYNEKNPFLEEALEEVNQNIVRKWKRAGATSKKAILQAYDAETGEILGHTHFIRQIEVDEKQFAKVYLSNFKNFFNLKPSAIKVFGYILNQLVPNKDQFIFLIDEAVEYTGYKSRSSVFGGLANLIENEIIARGKTDFLYFVNPMVVFNGNRLTFAKTYVLKEEEVLPANESKKALSSSKENDTEEEFKDPNQTSLLDQIEEQEGN